MKEDDRRPNTIRRSGSHPEEWCRYADAWLTVEVKWDLTADHAEIDALRERLAAC